MKKRFAFVISVNYTTDLEVKVEDVLIVEGTDENILKLKAEIEVAFAECSDGNDTQYNLSVMPISKEPISLELAKRIAFDDCYGDDSLDCDDN